MRINVFIDEIEFEGGGIEFNFHDQIKVKNAFERELTRLFMDEKVNEKSSIIGQTVGKQDKFSLSTLSIKDIDGGELSIVSGQKRNPYNVGKDLANSIYSTLNPINNNARGATN